MCDFNSFAFVEVYFMFQIGVWSTMMNIPRALEKNVYSGVVECIYTYISISINLYLDRNINILHLVS